MSPAPQEIRAFLSRQVVRYSRIRGNGDRKRKSVAWLVWEGEKARRTETREGRATERKSENPTEDTTKIESRRSDLIREAPPL